MGAIRLLEQGRYTFNSCTGNVQGTGLEGLVTKCEYFGIVFYIKEYYAPCGEYNTPSGYRWGLKLGNFAIKREDPGNILHLICPAAYFDFLAPIVTAMDDPLKRKVAKTSCGAAKAQKYIDKEPNQLFNPLTIKL
jgi:hypothetical protein